MQINKINKINSSTFTGSLVLPVCRENGNIQKLTIEEPSDIEAIVAEDEENTLIQFKKQGNKYYPIIEQELVPIPVSTVLTAYNSAVQAPKDAAIDIANL